MTTPENSILLSSEMGDKKQDSDNQKLEQFKYVTFFFRFVTRVY